MSDRGILLSKLEQEMLVNPEKLNPRQKRNLSYRLKTRSSQIGQVLQELKLLVDNIPDKSIKDNLSNEMLYCLMAILENFLQIQDPWPIGVDDKESGVMAFRIYGRQSDDPEKCMIFSTTHTATYEESELDYHLTNHFNKIRHYVDPCIPDPICHPPGYTLKVDEKIFKTKMELGEPYVEGSASYSDITGLSKSGWVLRKRVQIDINQLQWMKWKPRGLKECISQPPFLKEKDLPITWVSTASISSTSTREDDEEFRKQVQARNAMEIDEKDLLEVNEMIKRIPYSEEEYRKEDRKALKDKLNSLKWKLASGSTEPQPTNESIEKKQKK